MMNWASYGWDVTGYNIKLGEYTGIFVMLTFDSTSVSGVNGLQYDATNHVTTAPLLSSVPGSNIFDLFPMRQVKQFICLDGSSSVAASIAGPLKTGTMKIEWVESGGYFKMTSYGCTGTADPLAKADPGELISGVASTFTGAQFRGLLIGR